DSQVRLAELLGDPGADHVHTEDLATGAVGLLLGDHLHHALGLADDHRSAAAGVAVLRHHDLETGLLGRLLAVAGEGHLGGAVDAPRDSPVVDGHGVLAEDVADGDHALGERHVCELGGGDDIAHGPHTLDRRAAVL